MIGGGGGGGGGGGDDTYFRFQDPAGTKNCRQEVAQQQMIRGCFGGRGGGGAGVTWRNVNCEEKDTSTQKGRWLKEE
jgi:hypothetical protein